MSAMRLGLALVLALCLASHANAACNNLMVKLSTAASQGGVRFSGSRCAHGHMEQHGDDWVMLSNTGLYGPDCVIDWVKDGMFFSSARYQQNYCFMAAGDIHVSENKGAIQHYTVTKGDFDDGRGGQVEITYFQPAGEALVGEPVQGDTAALLGSLPEMAPFDVQQYMADHPGQ